MTGVTTTDSPMAVTTLAHPFYNQGRVKSPKKLGLLRKYSVAIYFTDSFQI